MSRENTCTICGATTSQGERVCSICRENAPKNITRMKRDSKKTYYLNIAAEVAKRSTCLRRQYGAIIVKNDEIIATGYNGAPRGEENCCDKGYCWREAHNVPSGEQYEKCVAVHAEMNAIISVARKDMLGATLYLAGWEDGKRLSNATPCAICAKLIKNAGIVKVVSNDSEEILGVRGIMNHHDI